MIIYTVIGRARDAAILVEVHSPDLSGNAPQVTAMLLSHLKDTPDLMEDGERKTFIQRNSDDTEEDFLSYFVDTVAQAMGDEPEDDHYFHILRKDGVFYCCIGDDADVRDQKVNFAFLDTICMEFAKRYRPGRINTAHAYAMDKDFSPSVRSTMHYHNTNHKSIAQEERVQKITAKVDRTKRIMGTNIQLLLERGENISKLVKTTEELKQDVQVFKSKAARIKARQQRKYYLKWVIVWTMVTIITASFMYVFTTVVCGKNLEYCKRADRSGGNGGE